MPKYKVPAEKTSMGDIAGPAGEKKHQPRLYIPANGEIMKVFELGDVAEVVIRGKIVGMTVNDMRQEIEIEVDDVTAYPENEWEQLSKEEEAE